MPEPRKFQEIMNITEIKILFEAFENEEAFIKTEEDRIEALNVTFSTNNDNETIYLVRFKDIGLDSKFGEIRIVCKNEFWEWQDYSTQLNSIKNKIIEQLILLNI